MWHRLNSKSMPARTGTAPATSGEHLRFHGARLLADPCCADGQRRRSLAACALLVETLLTAASLQLLQKPDVTLVLGIGNPFLDADAVFDVNNLSSDVGDFDLNRVLDQFVEASRSLRADPDVELAVRRDQGQARVCFEGRGVPRLDRIKALVESRRHPACVDVVEHVGQTFEIGRVRRGTDVEVVGDPRRAEQALCNAAEDDEPNVVSNEDLEKWPRTERRASVARVHALLSQMRRTRSALRGCRAAPRRVWRASRRSTARREGRAGQAGSSGRTRPRALGARGWPPSGRVGRARSSRSRTAPSLRVRPARAASAPLALALPG